MVLFKKRKKKKGLFHSWITLVILSIISVFLLFGVVDIIKKSQETRKSKRAALRQLAVLEEQEVQLESFIENLKTDEGIEESIRDRFFLVKEGEEFIMIVDGEKNDQNQDKNEKRINFIQFFKNLFR